MSRCCSQKSFGAKKIWAEPINIDKIIDYRIQMKIRFSSDWKRDVDQALGNTTLCHKKSKYISDLAGNAPLALRGIKKVINLL